MLQKCKIFPSQCKTYVIALFFVLRYNIIGYKLTIFLISIDKIMNM